MVATPYQPVSWNGETLSNSKLQQMTNNDQWLFENSARIRYSVNQITKDGGVKVMAGKSPYGISDTSAVYVDVYFGGFFSAGCHVAVTASLETGTGLGRKQVTIVGFGGEVDSRGFRAAVYTDEVRLDGSPPKIETSGFVHWLAVGY